MNLQNHGQPDQIGIGEHTIPYQLNQVMVPGSAPVLVSYEEILQQQQLQLQQKLQNFWANQNKDMQKTTDFKKRLPLSRLKKAMKADRDVKMISSETPTVIAKACEMFIQELTLRSWCHTEANRRRRLQKSDILSAINGTETFDFLADIVNRDGLKDDTMSIPVIDFDPSEESSSGMIINNSASEPMHVMKLSSSGLLYNVPPPRHPMPLTEFGPSNLPQQYAPLVSDTGMVLGKSAMDQPIHVQPSPAGTMDVMGGPSSLDPCNMQHQFPPQVGEMVTGKSAEDQPTYSVDIEEQMWRMEELEELESTYIERVTLWK